MLTGKRTGVKMSRAAVKKGMRAAYILSPSLMPKRPAASLVLDKVT